MKTIACTDCGQQVSKQAPKCPHCGKPRLVKRGCLFQLIVVVAIAIATVWWLSTGMVQQADQTLGQIKDKVAADTVEQYNIAKAQGDRMQICVQAGFVAAAYLQAHDTANYNGWKATEKSDCKRAGINR